MLDWEQAVAHIRTLPEFTQLVHDAYLDANPVEAVKRYAESEEWSAVYEQISRYRKKGVILDVGAGNGLASYAFALKGYPVFSLEPCDGATVGRGALERVKEETGVDINIINGTGESIPLPDESVDIIFARQVLHHAADLPAMCRELARVLKKDGILLAIREHVINREEDLQLFLDSHPIHSLYGGENAFLLGKYIDCLESAGFNILRCFAPWDSVFNLAPLNKRQLISRIIEKRNIPIMGSVIRRILRTPFVAELLFQYVRFKNRNTPGRLYSFLCTKP